MRYDPVPWLMAQEGLPAVRARRSNGFVRPGGIEVVGEIVLDLGDQQLKDGSFGHSVMKTAGALNLIVDLRPEAAGELIGRASSFLVSVLASQPGYDRSADVAPGSLTAPCDLCGFFGPYDRRADLELRGRGAQEMNFFSEYEPLLFRRSPVRSVPRSTRDRPGPGSCFEWGVIPLCYSLEAPFRSGWARDEGRARTQARSSARSVKAGAGSGTWAATLAARSMRGGRWARIQA